MATAMRHLQVHACSLTGRTWCIYVTSKLISGKLYQFCCRYHNGSNSVWVSKWVRMSLPLHAVHTVHAFAKAGVMHVFVRFILALRSDRAQ